MTPADDDKPNEDTPSQDEAGDEAADIDALTADDLDAEFPDDDDDEDGPKKKIPKKKLILIAVSALLGLLILGGGLAFALGWLDPILGIEEEVKSAEVELGAPVSFPLPQIKADLKTGLCRSPFLRISIIVQLSDSDLERLQASQDRITDQIITHLRDQERQDLAGREGSDQLRFDLVNIINHAIKPARIHGVIFKEFVLQ